MANDMTNARSLTIALGGKWHGSYGLTYCPAHHNVRTPALSLGDGADGRLLARCHTGCSFSAIVEALRGLGLLEDGFGYWQANPTFMWETECKLKVAAEKREHQAKRLWTESVPISGTAAEIYLRQRGITCDLPDSLRFHPSCWHASAERLPALVAKVEGAEGFAGVHRTYILPGGSGKADVHPNKAMLGSVRGGAVRLTAGPARLVVAEGVETALSLACGILDAPASIWAALSTSGMKGLQLPPRPGRLTVASDGDAPGREAAYALAMRADALGWQVSLLPAPEGCDWNDVLQGRVLA